ncbi:MAG: UDP-N-acetylmuramate--L-alanine ligase [Gaiellales bacterium]
MRPLAGRKLFFVGIGGAGLSGYAVLARAWGADVSGWDRYETPYLEHVRAAGIPVEIADAIPTPADGVETVVSTAFAERTLGKSRAEFLAELVSLQDAIVVSGAHGKTTTAAMIAFVLDRLGRDPSFLIGAEVPQLGGNARAGSGWLVVEGDESDRTVEQLRPKIAVVTNVDLDHHAEFGSLEEVEELFERWLAKVPQVVRGDELEPYDGELALTGEHNRRNAAAALEALVLAGIPGDDAWPVLREFRGAGRRLEEVGVAGDVRVVDDYAHHPAEIAATLAALREQGGGRILALFQPHLYSRTRHLARETAAALAGADLVAVTEIYAAREEPIAGVSGKLVLDALAELRPGMPLAWTPRVEDGAAFLVRRARPGDIVVTIGAGDVDRAAPSVLQELS